MSANDTSIDTIQNFLVATIARFTKQPADRIPHDAVLIDLGLQSIDAVILSGEVEDQFSIELDPSTIFEHDTLDSFAAEILRRREKHG